MEEVVSSEEEDEQVPPQEPDAWEPDPDEFMIATIALNLDMTGFPSREWLKTTFTKNRRALRRANHPDKAGDEWSEQFVMMENHFQTVETWCSKWQRLLRNLFLKQDETSRILVQCWCTKCFTQLQAMRQCTKCAVQGETKKNRQHTCKLGRKWNTFWRDSARNSECAKLRGVFLQAFSHMEGMPIQGSCLEGGCSIPVPKRQEVRDGAERKARSKMS